jgi:hypothetical protein
VKRRDLIGKIGEAARRRGLSWRLIRQGTAHELWALDGRWITIPRRREIKEGTARAIMKSFEEELGRRWWGA